jgi:hypothetical protein
MPDFGEIARELIESPDGHAAMWKVIADCEASGYPKIVKRAQQLRRRQEHIDQERGLTPPDA